MPFTAYQPTQPSQSTGFTPYTPTTPTADHMNGFSIIDSIKNSFNQRTSAGGDVINSNQNPVSKGLQVLGQGAGFIWDSVNAGINSVDTATGGHLNKAIQAGTKYVPDFVANKGGDAILAYEKWKQQHPEAAGNLEAVGNISTLVPVGAGIKVGAGISGEVASGVGKKLISSGEKGIKSDISALASDLVSPVRTNAVKEAQVGRTVETGVGPFKKSIITPTPAEARSAIEVAQVPGIGANKTYQQNYNIIRDHNIGLAQKLEADVAANNFLVPRKETIARLTEAKTSLQSSPVIVGDAEKTASKLLDGAIGFVNKNSGDGVGILKARKQYDSWVLEQKPKAFDATSENAFTIANRAVRDTLNKMLDEKATRVETKSLRGKQSALYNAMDNIEPKAAKEADTAFGRALQRTGEILGTKNKVVQGIAAGAGLTSLAALQVFAPATAVVGGLIFIGWQGKKLILNPKIRKAVGELLVNYGKVMNPEDKALLEDFYKGNIQNRAGLSIQEVKSGVPSQDTLPPKTQGQKIPGSVSYPNPNTTPPKVKGVIPQTNHLNGFQVMDNANRTPKVSPPEAPTTPITPKVENTPLAQEAQKYKSAEEFVKAKTGNFGLPTRDIADSVYKEVYKGENPVQMDISKLNPTEDSGTKKMLGLPDTFSGLKSGKSIDTPIIVTEKGTILDGNTRYHQALANGDKTVPVFVAKEPSVFKSQLTDIWNKAHGK